MPDTRELADEVETEIKVAIEDIRKVDPELASRLEHQIYRDGDSFVYKPGFKPGLQLHAKALIAGHAAEIVEFCDEPNTGLTKVLYNGFQFILPHPFVERLFATRDQRQETAATWCAGAFGVEHATNIEQRMIRLLEETVEAFQAAGGCAEMAHQLIDYVFGRAPGDLTQELGGVGLTLLTVANAVGVSADAVEACEVARVLSKPLEYFAARNQVKNAAGFDVSHGSKEDPDGR